MEAIQTFKNKKGQTLEIFQDDMCGESPRSWDNLATMVFFGNHRHLGDTHNVELDGYDSRSEFMDQGAEDVKKILDAAVVLPVHLYEHSGTGISTSYTYPYNCRWDSGTCGFVVVTKEAIRKEYSIKKVTAKYIAKAARIAVGEVETLNQYVSGDVYGFKLTDKDGEEDSCWGFYGSDLSTNGILDHVDEEWKDIVVDG